MSEEITTKSPNLKLAAHLLKRLTDASAADPIAADIARLSGPLYEVVLSVIGEGRNTDARKKRLQAEIFASDHKLDFLQSEIDLADISADLSTLSTSSGWDSFDLADFQDIEIPPTEYLIKPYLARPGVAIFFGRPKDLKSLLVEDLCIHVANGINWLASGPNSTDGIPVQKGRVAWYDAENGNVLMKRRLKAFQAAIGGRVAPGQFIFWSFPSPALDLSQDNQANEMIARLQSLGGIDLFVIDHLSQVMGPEVDENSPMAGRVMGNIKRISEVCNMSIVCIHHANKFTKQGTQLSDQLRGSGAILANIDSLIFVKRDMVNRSEIEIIPAAVRGPEIKNISANFSYTQDEYLDLKEARFWKIAWRDAYSIARDVILNALKGDTELNQRQLRKACKDSNVTDQMARDTLDTLVSSGEIVMRTGPHKSYIYNLAGDNDEDTD